MSFSINKVAILGAGVMGAGIAAHIVGAGIPVCLLDIAPKTLTDKEKAKGLSLQSPSVRNRIAQAGKDRVLNPKYKAIYDKKMGDMITVGNFDDDMSMLEDCDWVIEVIVENLKLKRTFMKTISQYIKPGTIVTTNTSGISINEIVTEMPLDFRRRFMGTHFFNPPRYMKLFELIAGEDTDSDLVAFMENFGCHRLGKGVVMAKDTPGFVANRIGSHALVTAVKMTEKYGYDVWKADQLTGAVIGRPKSATFRTIDMVGLDIFLNVASNTIDKVSSEEEKAALTSPDFVKKMVASGQLGDKTRAGFYKKTVVDQKKQTLVWDYKQETYSPLKKEKLPILETVLNQKNALQALVYGDSTEHQFIWEIIKSTLLYSAKLVPEITEDYRAIDQAMMWGYNWQKGPFAIWDEIDFAKSIKKMQSEGDELPDWILKRLNEGKSNFYDNAVQEAPYIVLGSPKMTVIKENEGAFLKDIGDGVACLEFKTKGNTVTDDVIEMILEAVETVETQDYQGLVIANQAKNFSAGANLARISQLIDARDWASIEKMVMDFQNANMVMKYAKKPVVTAPYGMTLGGGAEMAMHGYRQVIHAETYMGLVELGVGLIPAGGGTKEILCRTASKNVKAPLSVQLNNVKKAWQLIAMAKVSSSAHDALNKGYIKDTDQIVMNLDYQISTAKKMVKNLYDNTFKPNVKSDIVVTGKKGFGFISDAILFMKNGKFISDYDAHLASKVAFVLTGGNVLAGTSLCVDRLLELEKEAFLSLCGESKTQDRIKHMLNKGKPLRN